MSVRDFDKVVSFRNITTNKYVAIDYDKFEENFGTMFYKADLSVGQILLLEEIKEALEENNEICIKIGYKSI